MTMGDLGAVRLRIHSTGMANYPAGTTFGPRVLGDYEFVWIVQGHVSGEVDGTPFRAGPGAVLLGRPGQRDFFAWDPERQTRHGFIHFALLAGADALPPPTTWPQLRELPEGDILRPLFEHIGFLLSSQPPGHAELVEAALRLALGAFVSGALATATRPVAIEHALVQTVFAWVQELWSDGPMDPPTLGDCARVAGVTRAHLARVFKAEIGMGPIEALRRLRLDRAVMLLARTNLAIQDIAAQTGFPNAFHFSKVFHAQYGRSPRDMRKALLAGEVIPMSGLHGRQRL
jgi:AraC family transcriptional regulator